MALSFFKWLFQACPIKCKQRNTLFHMEFGHWEYVHLSECVQCKRLHLLDRNRRILDDFPPDEARKQGYISYYKRLEKELKGEEC